MSHSRDGTVVNAGQKQFDDWQLAAKGHPENFANTSFLQSLQVG